MATESSKRSVHCGCRAASVRYAGPATSPAPCYQRPACDSRGLALSLDRGRLWVGTRRWSSTRQASANQRQPARSAGQLRRVSANGPDRYRGRTQSSPAEVMEERDWSFPSRGYRCSAPSTSQQEHTRRHQASADRPVALRYEREPGHGPAQTLRRPEHDRPAGSAWVRSRRHSLVACERSGRDDDIRLA